MTVPSFIRETPEHLLHCEEQERRIEALEEIIRVQANTISRLQQIASRACSSLDALTAGRVHGGRRA